MARGQLNAPQLGLIHVLRFLRFSLRCLFGVFGGLLVEINGQSNIVFNPDALKRAG